MLRAVCCRQLAVAGSAVAPTLARIRAAAAVSQCRHVCSSVVVANRRNKPRSSDSSGGSGGGGGRADGGGGSRRRGGGGSSPHSDVVDVSSELDDVARARAFKAKFAAKQGWSKVQFVDCSSALQLYERAHFLGAVPVPPAYATMKSQNAGLHVLTRQEVTAVAETLKLDEETHVIAYDDRNGLIASRFVWALLYYGHHRAFVPSGGWSEWLRRHQPVGTGSASIEAHAAEEAPLTPFVATPRRDYIAYAADLLEEGTQIIDVRSEEEYSGATSHGNMRAGHVPGAVHLEWSDFRDPAHPELLKSVEEREALLQGAGVDKSKPVIVYCQSGIRAAYAFMAIIELGYSVALYDASMGEWLNDPNLPVEQS